MSSGASKVDYSRKAKGGSTSRYWETLTWTLFCFCKQKREREMVIFLQTPCLTLLSCNSLVKLFLLQFRGFIIQILFDKANVTEFSLVQSLAVLGTNSYATQTTADVRMFFYAFFFVCLLLIPKQTCVFAWFQLTKIQSNVKITSAMQCLDNIPGNLMSFMLWLVFQDRPDIPPTHAQAAARQISPESYSYTASILRLLRNKAFILLVITYGECLNPVAQDVTE